MKLHRRILSFMMVIMAVVSMSFLYIPVSPAKTAEAKKSSAVRKPSKKSLSSTAAIIMDLSTGTVVYRKNIHKKLYPASITKILTTYLACTHSEPDEKVRFSKNACYNIQGDASRLWPYTKPGEIISMNDCLYSMMLQSANEVCVAVAEHISGSSEKFVDLMNRQIADWGLKDTHFNNPNGLHDPDHYTSAYDMARIGFYAMKNPLFRKVTGTKTYSVAKTNKYHKKRFLTNHHNMLTAYTTAKYEYKYCIGGKTGFTDHALSTLVTFAEKDGTQLVCVVMHGAAATAEGKNIYTDTRELLNYAFEKYTTKTLSDSASSLEDKLFTDYSAYYSDDRSPLKISGDPVVFVPADAKLSEIKKKITYKKNPVSENGENIIGTITYMYDGKKAGSNDIIYSPVKTTSINAGASEQSSAGISSPKRMNIFISAVNHVKFWFINAFQSARAFFRGKLVLIIMILLAAFLLFLFVVQAREKRHSRGSYKYRKEHAEKARKSDSGSVHFSKKNSVNRHMSSGRSSFSEGTQTGPSLSFSSGRSKAVNRHMKAEKSSFGAENARSSRGAGLSFTKRHKRNGRASSGSADFSMSSGTGLSFRRHKRKSSVEGTIKNNFTAPEEKKPRTRRSRRASFTDFTSPLSGKSTDRPVSEPDTSASSRAKKTRKRHKNTYESFGKNMFDYDADSKKNKSGRR